MPPAPPPVSPVRSPGGPGAAGAPGVGEAGGGQPTHISTELVRTLWPMLAAVPGRLGGSREIVRQLFLLVGKMLTSLRMVLARQVGWTAGVMRGQRGGGGALSDVYAGSVDTFLLATLRIYRRSRIHDENRDG